MAQINLHTTPEFEDDLATVMRERKIGSKSEAIRLAVHETAEKCGKPRAPDWDAIIGWVHRLPGGWHSDKTSKELLDEIDQEMEEKLDRLSRDIWTKPK